MSFDTYQLKINNSKRYSGTGREEMNIFLITRHGITSLINPLTPKPNNGTKYHNVLNIWSILIKFEL